MTPEQAAALDVAAKAELWRRGDLSWKLHSGQALIASTVAASPHREHFVLCSRRYGKSYYAMVRAFELCLATPGARVLFLAPTANDAELIAGDTALKLLADCPADVAPEYRAGAREFAFPRTGAVIRIRGTNNQTAANLRGGEAHLVVLDECGQMDELKAVVEGVVMPMTLTTRGRILYLTTPPESPSHHSMKIFDKLHERGATNTFVLPDAPHIPHEEKARILIDHGEKPERVEDILAGRAEPEENYVQREYWCRRVVDRELAVVPEFLAHRAEIVVDSYPRPPFFDAYGSADMGIRDRTGILAGYLDFTNQRIVVEGERLLGGPEAHTAAVAATWSLLEADLGYNQLAKVTRVVDDPSLRVSADLTALGFPTQPVYKPGREAAIAAMRTAITGGRLRILSSCKQLIHQLETAIYKKSEKSLDFQRDTDGHFDLVDALIYLVRSVLWTKNPYPADWGMRQLHDSSVAAWRPPPKAHSRLNQALFGGTPSGRRLLKRGSS